MSTSGVKTQASKIGPSPAIDLRAIFTGVAVTLALTLLISLILALAIYFTSVTETAVSGLLYYLGLAAVTMGGAIAARRASSRGLIHGSLAGIAYVLVAVLVGTLLFPGGIVLADVGRKLLTSLLAGGVGGVISLNL